MLMKEIVFFSKKSTLWTKNSTFDLRQINFEIDRYVVEGTTGNNEDQYVLFPDYHYNI